MKSCLLSLVVLSVLSVTSFAQSVAPGERTDARAARATLGRLPLYFVENRGLYPDEVRYSIVGADKSLFFSDRGVTIALEGRQRRWAVKLDFVGAGAEVQPAGLHQQAAVFSYFKGAEQDWQAGLRTYSSVVYRSLWAGIDLVYNGSVNQLKYEFKVAPGADPGQIRLRYRGASSLTVAADGALQVATPEGSFEDAPPVAWQEVGGKRVAVEMAYALGTDGTYGFTVGEYDRTRPLVLDPAVIVYCGYIGGDDTDEAYAITVDGAGSVYVAGLTYRGASTFPLKVGPDLGYNGGDFDVFVAKVRADGTALEYCGYIGGASVELAEGIAVDRSGCAYVVGWTKSSQATFPVKAGPGLSFKGGTDGFIAKVDAKGTALVYCGYIGGDADDGARGVAIDAAGRAHVSGRTTSSAASFPLAVGPDLTFNGVEDAFVARVNAAGTAFDYCGYIGGAAADSAWGIAVDAAGNACVTGQTSSTEATFPVAVGPDLTHNGLMDGFVARVNPQGTGLVYCGYVGGSADDVGKGVAVDGSGSAFVAGWTASTEKTFPVKLGPDTTANGSLDAFVAKVAATGAGLDYCGFIGGVGVETAEGVAVDSFGDVFVAGRTDSDENTFPVTVGPDLTYNGSADIYLAKVSAPGTALAYCGYVGGMFVEFGGALAVDGAGNAYVGGRTTSPETTLPVTVGPDLTKNGPLGLDAFVAKVALVRLEAGGAPRPGGLVSFTLTSSDDGGLPYVLGSSFGTGPIPIGARKLGLAVDDLLVLTVNSELPTVFVGYQGVIGAHGRAAAKINLPAIPALVGRRIHTAFVTVSAKAAFGIQSISNTYSFTITP